MEIEANCVDSHDPRFPESSNPKLPKEAMIVASPRALARISAWGVRRYGSRPFQRTPVVTFSRNLVRRYATDSQESNTPIITEGEQQLINKLRAKFNPSKLSVQDVSGISPIKTKSALAC